METTNKKLFLLLLLSAYFFFGCEDPPTDSSGDNYIYTVPEETGDGWETASLSSVGMNTDELVTLAKMINLKLYQEVHSVVIVKDDKLVFEEYFPGHDFGYSGQTSNNLTS